MWVCMILCPIFKLNQHSLPCMYMCFGQLGVNYLCGCKSRNRWTSVPVTQRWMRATSTCIHSSLSTWSAGLQQVNKQPHFRGWIKNTAAGAYWLSGLAVYIFSGLLSVRLWYLIMFVGMNRDCDCKANNVAGHLWRSLRHVEISLLMDLFCFALNSRPFPYFSIPGTCWIWWQRVEETGMGPCTGSISNFSCGKYVTVGWARRH